MFKRVRNKSSKGQAMIETVCVLALHFFLIGFMITGFQIMHNKMVYSMAAYEGVRTAVAYNPKTKGYNVSGGISRAKDVVKSQIGSTKGSVNVSITSKGDYYQCTVSATVKCLFPIIDPNLKGGTRKEVPVSSTFTMRKERP